MPGNLVLAKRKDPGGHLLTVPPWPQQGAGGRRGGAGADQGLAPGLLPGGSRRLRSIACGTRGSTRDQRHKVMVPPAHLITRERDAEKQAWQARPVLWPGRGLSGPDAAVASSRPLAPRTQRSRAWGCKERVGLPGLINHAGGRGRRDRKGRHGAPSEPPGGPGTGSVLTERPTVAVFHRDARLKHPCPLTPLVQPRNRAAGLGSRGPGPCGCHGPVLGEGWREGLSLVQMEMPSGYPTKAPQTRGAVSRGPRDDQ